MRSAFQRCEGLIGPAIVQMCLLPLGVHPAAAQDWPRVTISEPAARASVKAALDAAVRWSAHARCQTLLTDFEDEQGYPLSERLATLGTTFDAYLSWVSIHDASGIGPCKNANQFAYTKIGSRVIFVCGSTFRKLWEREADRATAVIVHETLHTLGLGENGRFPTSREITTAVLDRCATLFR